MTYEEDIIIGKHNGAMIFCDEDTGYYYWEDANGVVGGEDFDAITDCMSDIDAQREYETKALENPMAHIGRY
jgi:hypothetical protein